MTIRRIAPIYNPCIAGEVRKLSQDVSHNTKEQQELNEYTDNLIELLLTYVDEADPTSYYEQPVTINETMILSARHQPPIKLELLENFGATTAGQVAAQVIAWDPDISAYDGISDPFIAYDIFDKWAHALDGDRGYIGYDRERQVLYMRDMNSPTERDCEITVALKRDETQMATDVDTGQTFDLFGRYVRAGRQIPTTARIGATWFPGPKLWYPTTIDVCDEAETP